MDLRSKFEMEFRDKSIASISEDVFSGLPDFSTIFSDGAPHQGLTIHFGHNRLTSLPENVFHGLRPFLRTVFLWENHFTTLPEGIFQGQPQLNDVQFGSSVLVGFPPAIFADQSATVQVSASTNFMACAPMNSDMMGLPACPTGAGCEPGTAYDKSNGLCVDCPTGLQLLVPGVVGSSTAACVPAGWDATVLTFCGSCAFWVTPAGVLVRTGSCQSDCYGMNIHVPPSGVTYPAITSVAEDTFTGLMRLNNIHDSNNILGLLGCLPFPDSVNLYTPGSMGSPTGYKTPRCPANCAEGTYFVNAPNSCPTAHDGICDEKLGLCDPGTDCADCRREQCPTAACLSLDDNAPGYAGTCLPCGHGLTTAGVGAYGAKHCTFAIATCAGALAKMNDFVRCAHVHASFWFRLYLA